jgi:tight adherence protein B
MNARTLPLLFMVLSCLALVGLFVSAGLVSRSRKTHIRLQARIAAASTPCAKAAQVPLTAFTRAPAQQSRSIASKAASVFGFNAENPAQYPLAWWVILIITAVISKVIQAACAGFAGDATYLGIPAVWLLLSRNVFGWFDGRRRQALLQQFPDALAMIVRSVRVGIPVMEAVRNVAREMPAPTGPEFARLMDQLSIGARLDDALLEMARRCAIPEYRFFSTTLALQNQTGGTLSDALDTLADVIRKRIALIERGKAMSSEAKVSAMVLVALPILTAVALWVLNPTYFSILLNDPTGKTLFGGAVLSLGFGVFMIRTMIRKSLS